MSKVSGEITDIIYYNEDNGYSVAELETKEDAAIIVGYLMGICIGDKINAEGNWIKHNVYGEQFKVDFFEKETPKTKDAIYKYLSSGIVKGVREATAKKIIEKFGEKSLEIIENEPFKLADISGISAKKALEISKSYIEQMGASNLIMFLQEYNISPNMSGKVYKKFGPNAKEIIKHNPYVLCDEIEGIGFKTADTAALKMGIDKENGFRIKSGTLYTLKYNTQFGHTYLPLSNLLSLSSKLLSVGEDLVKNQIGLLREEGALVCDDITGIETGKNDNDSAVYYYPHYFAEKYVAKRLNEFANMRFCENEEKLLKDIERNEQNQKIKLDDMQRQAVISAMQNGALVITGGPGTGKTTIINTIISIMEERGLSVALTAPTGRAAKRMSTVCRRKAQTIHRLLGVDFTDNDEIGFCSDESNPLGADIVIVDEMSMVDILLMQSLLRAIKKGARLIMVGDINQLPSVGAGNVLNDIIESGKISVIRLNKIFRQASKSMIVVNAHRINDGKMPVCNGEDTDFFFAGIKNAQKGAQYIVSLCFEKLPEKYNISSFDIQVLSPYKKGISGVINLNKIIQEKINPPSETKNEKEHSGVVFREGDKVMQIKNNYDLKWKNYENGEEGSGVFNGDVGYIHTINKLLKTVNVIFDEKIVTYDYKELDELDLAYAITVHKSQGSEFECVVIPVYDGPYMLMNRNLFYTAVTRAKSVVVLVGVEEVIKKMIDNTKETKRFSALKERLMNL